MKNLASIVILNWNTAKDTIECIKSLKNQTFKNFEIILVDNGSRKEEIQKIDIFLKNERRLKIKVIKNRKNFGFCKGNNIGIRNSKGQFLVFLNNDTIVNKNWLKNLLKPFEDNKVGVVASKILFYNGIKNNVVQYVGGKLTLYGMPISEGTGTKDRKKYNKQKEVFWAMGASFAVRKKIFNELKEMFPDEYFIYFEEVDLCWRIKNLGYKVIYCPDSIVYHKGSIAIKKGRLEQKQNRLTTRNKLLTFWRNLPTIQILLITPLIIIFDLTRCVKHLFIGDIRFVTGFFLGLKDFIIIYPKVKKPKNGSLFQLSW